MVGSVSQKLRILIDAKNNSRAVLQNVQADADKTFGDRPGGLTALGNKAKLALLGVSSVALAGIVTGLKNASEKAAAFEYEMDRVQALSGASAEEVKRLNEQAQQLGGQTIFTSTEVATGMQALAMAGYEVNDILAAMPGLLDTAAAGNTGLEETADIVSNVLSGFGLTADETQRLADVLAETFTTSNTTLRDLGATFEYVGPVARNAGWDLEIIAAAAGILGNTGIQGEKGGTALRGMLLKLQAPTEKAAKRLQELNVELTTADGSLKDLPDLIGELREGLRKLDPSEQATLLKELVGEEGFTGLQVLLDAGPEKIQAYADQLRDSLGTAQEIAKIQTDNLKGSFVELESNWDGLVIAIGERINPALKTLTDEGLIPLVGALRDLLEETTYEKTGEIGQLGETFEGVDEKTGKLTVTVRENKEALEELRKKARAVESAAVDVSGVVGVKLRDGFATLTDEFSTTTPGLNEYTENLKRQRDTVSDLSDEVDGAQKDWEDFKNSLPSGRDSLQELSEIVDQNTQSFQGLSEVKVDVGQMLPPGPELEKLGKVKIGAQLVAGINEKFKTAEGLGEALAGGLTEVIEGASFKNAIKGVATALGSMIGGPLGSVVGQVAAKAFGAIADLFSGKSEAEKRQDVLADLSGVIRRGDIRAFRSGGLLRETMPTGGSALLTLEAFQIAFGLDDTQTANLIQFLTTGGHTPEEWEEWNKLLGATENRKRMELARGLVIPGKEKPSGYGFIASDLAPVEPAPSTGKRKEEKTSGFGFTASELAPQTKSIDLFDLGLSGAGWSMLFLQRGDMTGLYQHIRDEAGLHGYNISLEQAQSLWRNQPIEVPAYAEGGWVPGPIGKPQLAVVHGGEFVVPSQEATGGFQGAAGPKIYITNQINALDSRDVEDYVERKLGPALLRYLRRDSRRGVEITQESGVSVREAV